MHEALEMKTPSDVYKNSLPRYDRLLEFGYPFHDRDTMVTRWTRICIHPKGTTTSAILAGQKLGVKEVDDGIWVGSFMHYDPGYIDLEQQILQTINALFGARLPPMSAVQPVTYQSGSAKEKVGRDDRIRTCDPHTPSVMRYQAALRPDRGAASRQESQGWQPSMQTERPVAPGAPPKPLHAVLIARCHLGYTAACR